MLWTARNWQPGLTQGCKSVCWRSKAGIELVTFRDSGLIETPDRSKTGRGRQVEEDRWKTGGRQVEDRSVTLEVRACLLFTSGHS